VRRPDEPGATAESGVEATGYDDESVGVPTEAADQPSLAAGVFGESVDFSVNTVLPERPVLDDGGVLPGVFPDRSVDDSPGFAFPGPAHPAVDTDTADMPALDLTPEPTRPRGKPYLTVSELCATGPNGAIFTDVSFSAARGELVALVGDSGTGRTSLLLSLAGRFRYDTGAVAIDGDGRPRHLRHRVAVARAGQAIGLDPHHTVGELMTESVLTGCRADPGEIRQVAELLGVRVDSGEIFGRLPAVDQTLLSLAFAAAARTTVIAIDDVDAGLGSIAAACVWAALRVLADNDHVVVAASVRPDQTPDILVRMGRPSGGVNVGMAGMRPTRRSATQHLYPVTEE